MNTSSTFVQSKKKDTKKKQRDASINFTFKSVVDEEVKRLNVVPESLLAKIKELEKALASLNEQPGRHTIRATKDLERQLEDLKSEQDDIVSGRKAREFQVVAERYLKEYKSCREDSNAKGSISDSLVRLADNQNIQRFRKRSDLTRTIRMAKRDTETASEKHSIRDEFLKEHMGESPPVYMCHGDFCPNCDEPMKRDVESSLMCAKCGISIYTQDATSAAVSWNDEMDYASFQYKRANHFTEWVNTSMAKQNCDVPDSILQEIMNKLQREKIKPEAVDATKIRCVLKEMKERKYYEHSLLIACRLTGRSPPRITPEQEDQLKVMFMQIQQPFEEVREKLFPERKNFLSYSYILFKFCEILGLEEFKQNFTLLKGKDKLHRQDHLFKAICEKLHWTFTPSV
tara:strand:- start:1531 stop:2733 length:1203 start_codon:yes stop_codon:yes gene_type:complete